MSLIVSSLATVFASLSLTGSVRYRETRSDRIHTNSYSYNASDYFEYIEKPVWGNPVTYSNYQFISQRPNALLSYANLVNNSPASFDNYYLRATYSLNVTYEEENATITASLFEFYIEKAPGSSTYDFCVSSSVGYSNIFVDEADFFCNGYGDYAFNFYGALVDMIGVDSVIASDITYIGGGFLLNFTKISYMAEQFYNTIYENMTTNEYADGYESGYNNGYNDGNSDGSLEGYDNGYREGYDEGKDDGLDLGRLQGYNEGYVAGAQSTGNPSFMGLFTSIADTPILMIRRLFGFEIFGTSALAVVFSLLTAFIIIKIVKKVLK